MFNNPFPQNVARIREWYAPFGDVCVATPIDGGGDVIYETGSYTWQAGVVAALRGRERRHEHTLVVHDDVLLAPGLDVVSLLGDHHHDAVLCHSNWTLAASVPSGWRWSLRVAAGWQWPMDYDLSALLDDCAAVLKASALYRRNESAIQRLPEARLQVEDDRLSGGPWAAAILEHLPLRGDTYWFGLPLRFGISDYFTFPNSIADEATDFLARTVRCNLFSEVAVPTMLGWSNKQIVSHHDRFDDRWTADTRSGLAFVTMDDVRAYFAARPDLIGAHPIKLSQIAG